MWPRGWGNGAFGEGRYGDGRAPRWQRALVWIFVIAATWITGYWLIRLIVGVGLIFGL